MNACYEPNIICLLLLLYTLFSARLSHGWQCDMIFIKRVVVRYHEWAHCHFLTLQITVCLSCQTQQAMHNALCDVLWPKKYGKKIQNKNFTKTKFQHFPPIKFVSYHTRRITPQCYFRWNMTNIGAINITLVYDNNRLLHGLHFDMGFINEWHISYHKRVSAANEWVMWYVSRVDKIHIKVQPML